MKYVFRVIFDASVDLTLERSFAQRPCFGIRIGIVHVTEIKQMRDNCIKNNWVFEITPPVVFQLRYLILNQDNAKELSQIEVAQLAIVGFVT
jgi:hypothetical protein